MAKVAISHLVKRFGDGTLAVDDVSIDVQDGEFMVLLGPSGCGKTTTLRCVAGLERQTSGDIVIGERVVNHLAPADRDIAFVFQFYALYPHMSAYDNIAFPLRAAKIAEQEVRTRVHRVAQLMRIEESLMRRPDKLSSGEQQRVALCRAIVRHPHVFLMDEPLTNLDPALRLDMRVELKALQQQLATTMLYVTHDQIEAMSMARRIAVMNKGVLQQVGTPLEVYDHPATLFVAGFIGSPPMNLQPCEVQSDRLVMQGVSINISADQVQRLTVSKVTRLKVGVRSEDITVSATTSASDEAAARGLIDAVEPLGDEIIYSVRVADGAGAAGAADRFWLAKTAPDTRFSVGDRVSLYFNSQRVHVFDQESERAIF
jgi:ABC-type sugar transport system ATPase subunit